MSEDTASRQENGALPFRLVVESAHLAGRAMTIVAGRWEQGTFYPGDYLELVKAGERRQARRQVLGTSIDAYRRPDPDPSLGMLFGVVVEGVAPAEVCPGDVLRAVNRNGLPSRPAAPASGRFLPRLRRRVHRPVSRLHGRRGRKGPLLRLRVRLRGRRHARS